MIFDFVIIFFILIALFFGFKIGALKYLLKIASLLGGFIISLFLTSPCTTLIMSSPIGVNVTNGILSKFASSGLNETSSIKELLEAAGVPGIFSGFVSSMLGNPSNEELLNTIATKLSSIMISVIVFFILLVGATLIIFILKKVADGLRKNIVIRVIDGIFGMIVSISVYFLILTLVVAIVIGLQNLNIIQGNVGDFIGSQLNNSFGFFKYFHNNNIIVNIWNVLF